MKFSFLCTAKSCQTAFSIDQRFMENKESVVCPACGEEYPSVLLDGLREIAKLKVKFDKDCKDLNNDREYEKARGYSGKLSAVIIGDMPLIKTDGNQ